MVTISVYDTKKRKFSELPRMSGTRRRGTDTEAREGDHLTEVRHSGDSTERLNLPQSLRQHIGALTNTEP